MLTLGIDTTTELGSVGLWDGDKALGELTYYGRMSQSEKLLTSINRLIEFVEIEKDDLELISVSQGPGSFTGLRIGIATAKGLALALGIPLVGVPSTDSYVGRIVHSSDVICVLLKDRRNLVYQSLYRNGEKVVKEHSRPIAEVLKNAQESEQGWIFAGPAVIKYRERLSEIGGMMAPDAVNRPSGLTVAEIGRYNFLESREDQLLTLEPLYAQRPVAELKFNG